MDAGEQKIQPKVPRRATAIPLRSLGEKQLLTVKKAASLVERGSVLVGALPGASLEDLRPLFLRDGRLHLLRIIEPKEGMSAVGPIIDTLRTHGMAGAEFTLEGDRFWYIRPFFQTLLWESEAGSLQWDKKTVKAAVAGVFAEFLKFCLAGGIHGGIAPQNVAVNDKRLLLVDAGASLLARGLSGDGLRRSDGASVLQEADFVGLSQVLLDYFSEGQLEELSPFLNELLDTSIGTGAVLQKVKEQFSPAQVVPKRPGIIGTNMPPQEDAKPKGRILPGGMAVVAQPEIEKQSEDEPVKENPPEPAAAQTSEAKEADAPPPLISLTEDTVVQDESGPFAGLDTPAEPEEKALPTAQEVLAWAENTTSLSREVVSQIRVAVEKGVPQDRDSNPFLDESIVELEAEVEAQEKAEKKGEPRVRVNSSVKTIQVPKGQERIDDENRSLPALVTLGLGIGLILAFLYAVKGPEFYTNLFSSSQGDVAYVPYWESNIPSKMREVALRAIVDGDSEAEIAIVQDVMNGNKRPNVRMQFLQIAFSPLWEQNLSDQDRRLALMLGLASLVPPDAIEMPAVSEAYPGVILAVVANLPLEKNVGPAADIPVNRMGGLPSPFRESFAVLEAVGVKSFKELPARALARLTLGLTTPQSMIAFLNGASSSVQTIGFMRIVGGLLGTQPELAEVVEVVVVDSNNDDLKDAYGWFVTDPLSLWNEVQAVDKVAIIAGTFKSLSIHMEQFADLLRFPLPHVRQQAVQRLQMLPWSKGQQQTIAQLAVMPEEILSRTAVISLIVALSKPAAQQDSLIGLWFTTEPNPQAVFDLLMTRDQKREDDSFSLEAARYLKDKKFNWTMSQKKKLSSHREMLVRALVYTRLDPDNSTEREILESMVAVEPNSTIRKQLELKLEESEGTFAVPKVKTPAAPKPGVPGSVKTKEGFASDLKK